MYSKSFRFLSTCIERFQVYLWVCMKSSSRGLSVQASKKEN
jgi:hypothetical protein